MTGKTMADLTPIEAWLSRWGLSIEGQRELARGIFPEEGEDSLELPPEPTGTIVYTEATNPFGGG
jgi:hypothetical protein